MNLVDIAIIGVFAVSVLIGVFRGFIREALSLTSWVVSVSLAYLFVDVGVMYLEPHISQPLLRLGAAFAAIFIISLLLTSIIGYLLYRLLSIATKIGPGDRLLGLLFGCLRGAIIISLLILFAIFTDFSAQVWWKQSQLVGYFMPLVDFFISLMPDDIAIYFKPELVLLQPAEFYV